MRKGYLVISGCPRSGTSVNMDIQRAVHGEDAILGEKFPQDNRKQARLTALELQEGEAEHVWRVRRYLTEKEMAAEEAQTPEHVRDFHDMNPEGFWETHFTVRGITPYMVTNQGPVFSPQLQGWLDEVDGGAFRIAKVVSQGLLPSNPRYIGKVIYTIRHPRAVAKSQERLVRGFNYMGEDGKMHNAFEDLTIHTPEMFIEVTRSAAIFLLRNTTTPFRFYHFEELVSNPRPLIDDMGKFVGVGDYSKAYDVVQPKLNRSKHEDVDSPLWEDAEFVYNKFCEAAEIINGYAGENANAIFKRRQMASDHLNELLQYMSSPKRNFNREKRQWACYRAKRHVNEAICRACQECGSATRNMLIQSEDTPSSHGVTKHWSEEPCVFECGLDVDRDEYLTIEQSISNNFWHKVNAEIERDEQTEEKNDGPDE